MKLCKDCKRFVPYPSPSHPNEGLCADYPLSYYCVDAEGERSTNQEGFCGPHGKHWEAKIE